MTLLLRNRCRHRTTIVELSSPSPYCGGIAIGAEGRGSFCFYARNLVLLLLLERKGRSCTSDMKENVCKIRKIPIFGKW